jgi:hypothetical protein
MKHKFKIGEIFLKTSPHTTLYYFLYELAKNEDERYQFSKMYDRMSLYRPEKYLKLITDIFCE